MTVIGTNKRPRGYRCARHPGTRSSDNQVVNVPMAATPPLFGRAAELRAVEALIDGVPERGGALVVSGDPGIGKSALIATAARRAAERGMRVLKTTGLETESRLAFAGLHQLLHPALDGIGVLPGPQRDALGAAFGMTDASAPDLFLPALAALNLLADAAEPSGLLVIAEDAQWLDRSTADVLAFVARRLDCEPLVLVAAIRDGFESPLGTAGLQALHLEPLDPSASAALLDATAPDLSATARLQVLNEATGNPLALLELPLAITQHGARAPTPAWLPITTRLERAFAARVRDLPAATRSALLVAALNDEGSLSEVLTASAQLAQEEPTPDTLGPAISARIVDVDDASLAFRHPLMRAAIVQQASNSQRQQAHAALADVLLREPERRVWHRAASLIGPDDAVAFELEATAAQAQRRGASAVAVAGFERAAQLSADPVARGQRLLRAAELGFELGRADLVSRLLAEAEPLDLSPAQRSLALWLRGVFDGQQGGGADRLDKMIETAVILTEQGEDDLALKILWSASIQCWWSDPDRSIGERIVDAAESAQADELDPRPIAIAAFAAPVEQGAIVMDRLSRLGTAVAGNPDAARVFGTAANAIGAFDASAGVLAAATAGLRAQGRLGLLARALTQQAWSAAQRVDLSVGIPVGDEAERLTRDSTQPTIHYTARAIQAMLAALRGDRSQADAHAGDAEAFGLARGARALLAMARHASGLAALADGQYAEAYEHLARIHDPSDPAYHSFMRVLTVADLVDAAARSDQTDAVRPIVAELEIVAGQTPAPVLHAGLRYARPLLAGHGETEALFRIAMDSNAGWPFLRARAQLAHGEWLRRHRRAADARQHLRAARDTFDALGTIPWGDRARQELRASGETSRRRVPEARDELTAQELQIAQLAAKGMTNREIGQMLYVSHRTISSHLYRIFPKLDVTSRAELRDVLEHGVADSE